MITLTLMVVDKRVQRKSPDVMFTRRRVKCIGGIYVIGFISMAMYIKDVETSVHSESDRCDS